MATASDELSKHLSAAMALEQKGIELFSRYACEAENTYGRLLFKRLAEDEEQHLKWLTDLRQRIHTGSLHGSLEVLKPIDHRQILSPASRKPEEITRGYFQALSYAVDVEEKSFLIYKELEHLATNAQAKQIFTQLARFEQEHLELVKGEIDFALKNPGVVS